MTIYNEPPPGMFIVPDESDMTLVIKFWIFEVCNFIFILIVDVSYLIIYISIVKKWPNLLTYLNIWYCFNPK